MEEQRKLLVGSLTALSDRHTIALALLEPFFSSLSKPAIKGRPVQATLGSSVSPFRQASSNLCSSSRKFPPRKEASVSLPFRALALPLVLASVAVIVAAQIATGTIVGTVSSQEGGVMPNAEIKMTRNETNQVHTAHTNNQGAFNAPFMPLSTYSVSVSAPGFQTDILNGITLQIDQTAGPLRRNRSFHCWSLARDLHHRLGRQKHDL
jgi:hypothetical protein